MLNRLGFTIASYCLAIRFLYFAVLYSASVLTSSIRSRFKRSCSSLSLSWYIVTLWLGKCITVGMTASLPYASLKGVSLVGVLTIIRYAHRTPGSSSGYTPFAPSSRVLMILCKFPHQSILTTSKLLNWDCSDFLFNARMQDKGQTLPLPLKITLKISYGELHILPS